MSWGLENNSTYFSTFWHDKIENTNWMVHGSLKRSRWMTFLICYISEGLFSPLYMPIWGVCMRTQYVRNCAHLCPHSWSPHVLSSSIAFHLFFWYRASRWIWSLLDISVRLVGQWLPGCTHLGTLFQPKYRGLPFTHGFSQVLGTASTYYSLLPAC